MANNENQEKYNLKQDDEFIQEKIRNKRKQKTLKMFFTLLFVLVCGLVFGFAVRMAMIFTDGRLKDLFSGLDKTPTPVISQGPSDVPSTSTPEPTGPEVTSIPVSLTPIPTVVPATPGPTLAPIEGEIVVEVVDPSMPHPEFSYAGFYKEITALAEAVKPQIADITASKTLVDWFGNISYITSKVSGLVLAQNGQSLLILSDYNVLMDSESINVKILGKEMIGKIYSYDSDFGLAVLAVDMAAFSGEERDAIKYAKLFPDGEIKMGSPVVAVGNANGHPGSIAFGIINGINYKNYVTDGEIKYFTTDWTDYKNSSAFIYDMSGAVCGMITHTYKQDSSDGITTCISLERLKDVITALINGRSLMTLGLGVGELNPAIIEKSGISTGIYVKEVKNGSPAATVGIKAGDIITAIKDGAVISPADLTMYLAGMTGGESLTLALRRVEENSITDMRVVVVPALKNNSSERNKN